MFGRIKRLLAIKEEQLELEKEQTSLLRIIRSRMIETTYYLEKIYKKIK